MEQRVDPEPIDLTITGELAQLRSVRRSVLEYAERFGFTADEVAHICLAVDEALVNVIEHGYGGPCQEEIHVRLGPVERDGRRGLEIRIRDFGRKIEPERICGRDLDDVRPGGLGVHIMRSVMDEVEYRQADDRGMILQMVRLCSQ